MKLHNLQATMKYLYGHLENKNMANIFRSGGPTGVFVLSFSLYHLLSTGDEDLHGTFKYN